MPTPGLSLVGFMTDQQQAVNHLRQTCVPNPPNKDDAALIIDWNAAKVQLGPPFPNSGNPALQPIPLNDPHIQSLLQLPWAPYFQAFLAAGANFQMVEIDPLLAFQHSVDTARTNNHCAALTQPPTRDELFNVCLPPTLSNDDVHFSQAGQSLIVKSRSLNLTMTAQGLLTNLQNVVGVQINWTLPFVHVVRLNGRCYLHNGYHRAYGLRTAGATEMPCIFRDVLDAESVGIRIDGSTFSEALLASANPPTVGHFTQGRAYPVYLRRTMRLIQVNWSQHTMVDDE